MYINVLFIVILILLETEKWMRNKDSDKYKHTHKKHTRTHRHTQLQLHYIIEKVNFDKPIKRNQKFLEKQNLKCKNLNTRALS